MLDRLARTYNSESFQRAIHWIVGAEVSAAYGEPTDEDMEKPDDGSRAA